MLKDLAPANYLGKRCYVKSWGSFWLRPRTIKAIRKVRDEYGSTYWQVKVRNWFWHEWHSTNSISLEELVLDY